MGFQTYIKDSIYFFGTIYTAAHRKFHSISPLDAAGPTLYRGFTITHRHITIGRTILDEGSAPRTDLLPDNTQRSQETDIHAPAGLEPAITEGERSQTDALDRATTGIGCTKVLLIIKSQIK